VRESLAKLEEKLKAKEVKVVVGPQGAVAFKGWKDDDRDLVSDVCAYRMLTAGGSLALRQALMAAGGGVQSRAVIAGYHSHDGGQTWGKH